MELIDALGEAREQLLHLKKPEGVTCDCRTIIFADLFIKIDLTDNFYPIYKCSVYLSIPKTRRHFYIISIFFSFELYTY